MDVSKIKEYIYTNELIEEILTHLNCHHIKRKSGFWTAGNHDGDNPASIVVYENDNLTTLNYTRELTKQARTTDIFDLIMFVEQCTFPEALKWTCNIFGIDFYSEPEERAASLQILDMLRNMSLGVEDEDKTPLQPISLKILDYYLPYGNQLWRQEGISLTIQQEFQIGFDPRSGYITIPIFDSIGTLVGVKGRLFGQGDEYHPRFVYLEKCNKSKILYGLWQNQEFIKNSTTLFIVESEKSVLKLAEMGIRNVVATGGKYISKYQIELITRTGCTPIIAFDQDCEEDEIQTIANKFIAGIDVYAILDKQHLLNEKESPTDRQDIWQVLNAEHVYKIK